MLIQKLQQKLIDRAECNSLRVLSVSKNRVDFLSNDYLGFAQSESLAALIATEYVGIGKVLNGSTGSRLLSGNTKYAENLETFLSDLFLAERTLLLNSGYNANLAILSTIPQKGDTILYDEYIHASLKEGARLSFASRFPFKHNNLEDLESKIKKGKGNVFVVVESIYSMDGDFVPLVELVALAKKYGAYIVLDEAHSTGVIGASGNGLACALGVERDIFARIHTFGKAMGVHGACIAGSKILIDYLVNYARPFIYTTALPLHSLVSIKMAFDFLKNNSAIQGELMEKVLIFKNTFEENTKESSEPNLYLSPIQIVKIPGVSNVKKAADFLQKNGLDIRPILSPTVAEGDERLRICLHTGNTEEEITKLTVLIKELV